MMLPKGLLVVVLVCGFATDAADTDSGLALVSGFVDGTRWIAPNGFVAAFAAVGAVCFVCANGFVGADTSGLVEATRLMFPNGLLLGTSLADFFVSFPGPAGAGAGTSGFDEATRLRLPNGLTVVDFFVASFDVSAEPVSGFDEATRLILPKGLLVGADCFFDVVSMAAVGLLACTSGLDEATRLMLPKILFLWGALEPSFLEGAIAVVVVPGAVVVAVLVAEGFWEVLVCHEEFLVRGLVLGDDFGAALGWMVGEILEEEGASLEDVVVSGLKLGDTLGEAALGWVLGDSSVDVEPRGAKTVSALVDGFEVVVVAVLVLLVDCLGDESIGTMEATRLILPKRFLDAVVLGFPFLVDNEGAAGAMAVVVVPGAVVVAVLVADGFLDVLVCHEEFLVRGFVFGEDLGRAALG